MLFDTIIIGGGPAGAAAGVYAARKKMKTLLVTESFGGQSVVSDGIENWIGEIKITGFELAQKLEKHVRAQEDIEIKTGTKAVAVRKAGESFEMEVSDGKKFQAKTIVITSGGRHRRLEVPGEDKFEGKGVSYCSTCDAPFFRSKTVAVAGGGNSGLEAVIDLIPYAQKLYLIIRRDKSKGDPVTLEEVKNSSKVTIIANAQVQGIIGDQKVTGVRYKDKLSGETKKLSVDGVFVEIGMVPNSEIVKGLAELNEKGEIVIDHKTGATSVPGIFAAGDVTDELYKQNNIAVGDAITAVLSAHNYVLSRN